MDFHLVSTIYIASMLLLGSHLAAPTAALVYRSTSQNLFLLPSTIAPYFSQYEFAADSISGYKPPRDIGRPRRTGPSGGRVA